MLLTIKKKSASNGETKSVSKDYDFTSGELKKLFNEIKLNHSSDFGQFSMIYVDPDEYYLEGGGMTTKFKPQLWPTKYQKIIETFMEDLESSESDRT